MSRESQRGVITSEMDGTKDKKQLILQLDVMLTLIGKSPLLNIGLKILKIKIKIMSTTKEYKKLNSFKEFISKQFNVDQNEISKRILRILSNQSNFSNLSIKQKEILDNVKKDLFDKEENKKIKFSLSKHVIEEIKRLEDKNPVISCP